MWALGSSYRVSTIAISNPMHPMLSAAAGCQVGTRAALPWGHAWDIIQAVAGVFIIQAVAGVFVTGLDELG